MRAPAAVPSSLAWNGSGGGLVSAGVGQYALDWCPLCQFTVSVLSKAYTLTPLPKPPDAVRLPESRAFVAPAGTENFVE